MDTTQYLDVFIDESNEHIEVLYNKLLELEKNPNEKAIIEEIFRAAHTLKGMSATMGYNDLATITHTLENVFDAIRYDRVHVQSDMIDLLVDTVDHLNTMVGDIANGGNGSLDVTDITRKLEMMEKGKAITETNQEEKTERDSTTISNVFTKLDAFELSILNESKERGFQNFEITVQLREDCLLKGARVFMVFEVLEQLGEVIKSEPSVNDLEEENFDSSFSVILVSNQDAGEIAKKIKKVSEIEEVTVGHFSVSSYQETTESEVSPDSQGELNTPVLKDKTEKKVNDQDTKKGTHNNKTIRVNIEKLDVLMNLFEELIIDRGRLEQISLDLQNPDLKETVERMARVSSDLQNIILTMRMVPIDTVFSRFPRMVRKLARDLNKQVEIDIIGADTELDRTVIDEIGDPIVHLLRNAIDHGIESPEERIRKGKPEKGTIELKAYHSGNHVFIEITDDGAGINKDKVLQKAITNGILTEAEKEGLSEQQIYELILESGFSTADKISDISGRGVGLDVVKNTIESLGGRISIDSELHKGSVFSIQLPLTLTIISVLLVELNKEKYAIPLSSIIETAIISKEQILSAHHKKVIDFRGKVVPLVDLKGIFGVEEKTNTEEYTSIVIVKKGEKMAALIVDSFIGQQEIVLKSLGSFLSNIFAISGATILGDGEVALIIDSNAIIK